MRTIPTAARSRMHQRVAQVLEESHVGNLEPHMALLAHHYRKAAELGETEKAIDYSIRAGEAAFAVLAAEEAASHWEAALKLLERQDHTEERRAHLCLRLAGAMPSVDLVKWLDYGERDCVCSKICASQNGLLWRIGPSASLCPALARGCICGAHASTTAKPGRRWWDWKKISCPAWQGQAHSAQ